jgi:hypothetical protein
MDSMDGICLRIGLLYYSSAWLAFLTCVEPL